PLHQRLPGGGTRSPVQLRLGARVHSRLEGDDPGARAVGEAVVDVANGDAVTARGGTDLQGAGDEPLDVEAVWQIVDRRGWRPRQGAGERDLLAEQFGGQVERLDRVERAVERRFAGAGATEETGEHEREKAG